MSLVSCSGGEDSPGKDYNYIYLGEYPQTIKADDITITSTQDSRGYYLGSDGCYYAEVIADPCDSDYTFSTGATVTEGKVYYFKVEPIRWRILSEDGETAFILCDSIIANMAYGDVALLELQYKDSDIRAWLNGTFYETAFTELQQEIILTTTVDNSAISTGELFNGNSSEDTEDKIFLLSHEEVKNSEYGFASSLLDIEYDIDRRMQTSDYSRATGACMSILPEYYGIGDWWLRSPGYNTISAVKYVSYSGCSTNLYTSMSRSDMGVVPAMWINLES